MSTLPTTPKTAPTDSAMPLLAHLAELRYRLVFSITTLLLGIVVAFFVSLPVIEWLKTLAPMSVQFVQLSPGEVLMASVRVAFLLGLALATPVLLYQTLRFVLPGLNRWERWILFWSVVGGTLLFLLGVSFAYWAVIPSALGYLLEYGQQVAISQISIVKYVEFCTGLLILTGILFELPMILFLLSFTRLVTSTLLLRQWRWAVVIIFLVAAVITPSQDPITLIVVASAMGGLYFLSILPIKLCGR